MEDRLTLSVPGQDVAPTGSDDPPVIPTNATPYDQNSPNRYSQSFRKVPERIGQRLVRLDGRTVRRNRSQIEPKNQTASRGCVLSDTKLGDGQRCIIFLF